MFCNLILKGFNEVFICNSVISELGLVHGPGYLFTHLDQKLAHFNGCNCDLFCRALLCATEQTLWHGQTFRAKPKVNFTQSAFKQNPHRYILTKGGLSLYKSRWKEGSLMRPPHLMVQEPWKCTTGSQDCLVAPRKRASWRTRFREGTCSGLQNKSASWRGLLLRPNLARSSSFSFFFFTCFYSSWLFAARHCFVLFLLFLSLTRRGCFISNLPLWKQKVWLLKGRLRTWNGQSL